MQADCEVTVRQYMLKYYTLSPPKKNGYYYYYYWSNENVSHWEKKKKTKHSDNRIEVHLIVAKKNYIVASAKSAA